MNIACTVCPARYAIPDVKIVGRRVRITCKRCGSRLTVDGTQDPALVVAEESLPPPEQAPAEPAAEPASEPDRFLVALDGQRQESLDVREIVEAYAAGTITAQTFAWREDMSGWKLLFDIDVIAEALRAAGYSGAPEPGAYSEDDEGVTHAAYREDDEGVTHAAYREDDEGVTQARADLSLADEDEATRVFDTENVGAGAWNEPANWKKQSGGRDVLAVAQWREQAAVESVPKPASIPPGAWNERGVEEDEVTRMVAPLEDDHYLSQYRDAPRAAAPASSRSPARSSSVRPASRSTPPPSARGASRSTPPPSQDDSERLTGQRGDSSVLFSLNALVRNEAASRKPPAPSHHADEALLVAPSAIAPLRADLDLLAPPSSAPPPMPRSAQAALPSPIAPETPQASPKSGGRFRAFLLVVLLLVAGALSALYATGRWSLVTQTANSVWQKVVGR